MHVRKDIEYAQQQQLTKSRRAFTEFAGTVRLYDMIYLAMEQKYHIELAHHNHFLYQRSGTPPAVNTKDVLPPILGFWNA